jgi:hypothetical protein
LFGDIPERSYPSGQVHKNTLLCLNLFRNKSRPMTTGHLFT